MRRRESSFGKMSPGLSNVKHGCWYFSDVDIVFKDGPGKNSNRDGRAL